MTPDCGRDHSRSILFFYEEFAPATEASVFPRLRGQCLASGGTVAGPRIVALEGRGRRTRPCPVHRPSPALDARLPGLRSPGRVTAVPARPSHRHQPCGPGLDPPAPL